MKHKRLTVIDILRGISVICMLAYHTMWDLVYVHGISVPFFEGMGGGIFQAYIRWSFIIISGFSWCLGKKHLARGLAVFAASAVITLATYFMMRENIIKYGVLTLISTAMLLMIPLDRLFKKLHPLIGITASAAVFAFTYRAGHGYLGLGKLLEIELPSFLYANELTAYLGFPKSGFFSADYVPVIPWLFLFFFGYFLYKIFERYGWLKALSFVSVKPLEFVGRHALPIYVLHQPVIYGALYLIFKVI